MGLPFLEVNASDPRHVAALVELPRAREPRKYACPVCGSSDALHAYRPGAGFYCWSGCARKFSIVDLGIVLWGLTPAEACRRMAGLLGIPCPAWAGPSSEASPAPLVAPRRPLVAPVDPLDAVRELPDPKFPPVLFGTALAALTLTDAGAAYLRGRGFDPDAAQAYGFRSIDGPDDWFRLRCAVADAGYRKPERRAAGLDVLQLPPSRDWWAAQPHALVIPYRYQGATVGMRFRALDGTAPKLVGLTGYRLPVPFNVDAAASADVLHVAEGELNGWALHTAGAAAWGLPGAGGWRPEWAQRLSHVRRLFAWFDADTAGDRGAARLGESLAAEMGREWVEERCQRVRLPAGVDANDLWKRGDLDDQLSALDR